MIHTLIIWNKAFNKKEFILNDINESFKIINVFDYSWTKDNFHTNLKRFYSHSQYMRNEKSFNKIITKKIKHCGNGPFTLVVFEDEKPDLRNRQTSSGNSIVNTNVFDKKAKYRALTDGGHKIHSSDNSFETNKDLILLLGLTTEEFLEKHSKKEIKPIPEDRNILGVPYWKNIHDLFKVLNHSINYVVLRNFECLPDEYTVEGHGDIDVLVENTNYMKYLTGAKKVLPKKRHRCNFTININNEAIPFDFRYIGDNYYDVEWEKNILKTKKLAKNSFYIPNDTNHFHSLLYHALIHKPKMNVDYITKLNSLNTSSNYNNLKSIKEYNIFLSIFLEKNQYNYTTPQDRSVYTNEENTNYTNYSELSFNKYKKLVTNSTTILNNQNITTQVFKYNGAFIKKANKPIISNEINCLTKLEKSTLYPKVLKVNNYVNCDEIYISEIKGLEFSKLKKSPKFWKKRHVINTCENLLNILISLTENDILHRDIRPENIILERQNMLFTPVLIDFGWATNISNIETAYPEGLGYKHKYGEGEFSDAFSIAKCLKTEFPDFSFTKKLKHSLLKITPENYKNKEVLLKQLETLKSNQKHLKFNTLDHVLLITKRIKSWFKQVV